MFILCVYCKCGIILTVLGFLCVYMCSHSMFYVPAGVYMALAYGASEEAFTAVTAGGSIVFPCGFVSTDGTVAADPVWTGQARLCRHAV